MPDDDDDGVLLGGGRGWMAAEMLVIFVVLIVKGGSGRVSDWPEVAPPGRGPLMLTMGVPICGFRMDPFPSTTCSWLVNSHIMINL